jgi:hypothetical protein
MNKTLLYVLCGALVIGGVILIQGLEKSQTDLIDAVVVALADKKPTTVKDIGTALDPIKDIPYLDTLQYLNADEPRAKKIQPLITNILEVLAKADPKKEDDNLTLNENTTNLLAELVESAGNSTQYETFLNYLLTPKVVDEFKALVKKTVESAKDQTVAALTKVIKDTDEAAAKQLAESLKLAQPGRSITQILSLSGAISQLPALTKFLQNIAKDPKNCKLLQDNKFVYEAVTGIAALSKDVNLQNALTGIETTIATAELEVALKNFADSLRTLARQK